MADDPLDQSARDGGRPKHEPPTIDLEASDVSGETNAAAPSDTRRASFTGLLTPLLSGAVAALAVCGALWAGGVIGIDQAAPPQPVSQADHAALAAKANDLAARLAKLEARPQTPVASQAPAVEPARLAALEKSAAALQEDVAALRAELARRASAPQPVPASPANAAPDIAALRERLTKLEQAPRVEAPAPVVVDDLPLRRATVAAALDAQVQRGEPYAPLLASAKRVAAKAEALAPLESFAASGLPDDTKLSRDLIALLPQLAPKPAPQAAPSAAASSSLLERLQANAAKLVHVERVEDGASASSSALNAVEAAAKRNDVAAARRAIDQLPADARALAKPWTDAVDAREAARAALRQFSQDAMTALTKTAP